MTKEQFVAAAIGAARALSAQSGLPLGISVAQAALESSWGNSLLARLANNYFGIKARPGRAWVDLPTTEVVNGIARKIVARFARYNSMKECFEDREQMILHLPAYAEARARASNPAQFAAALAQHWATDPGYAEKILRIYAEHGFDSLDRAEPDTQPSSTILKERT
jgi:flagellum-specific peptidoglycan hydrolase FlgJ